MPTISRFYGIVIQMYMGDHAPPHVHVRYQGMRAVLRIDDGEMIRGELPRRALRMVREWMRLHREELMADWDRSSRNEPILPIDPLP